jgi:hypothetical protein
VPAGAQFGGRRSATYSLGVILEQLLIETDLRLVILDPNWDLVRMGSVLGGTDPALAGRSRQAAR